jgi:predicted MPP superfamily phosphohydrolase
MNWINALALLLIAGHCELLVMAVNRLHALRLPGPLLKTVRHVHDVLMLAGAPLIVWFVGFTGPKVLLGGTWRELSPGWMIYFGLCAAGAIGLAVTAVRYQSCPLPAALLSNHSDVIDVAEKLRRRPLAPGPYQWLARLPGNELFRVEVSQKTLQLPRLPAEWDGLSILHLSDLHFIGTLDLPFFEEVSRLSAEQNAELIVFTGDLLDNQQLVEWLPATLGKLSAPLGCHFILGNHDWYLDPEPIRRALVDLGWHDVAGKVSMLEHRGLPLAIGGSELPWMGRHPDFATAPPEAFRLILSHTPDNLAWAVREGVDLMLSGHNHGGQVVLPLLGPVYSPSVYGCRYASGLFWQSPTLLHVSRGISGRHPFRWRCKPELTKLVLRSAPPGVEPAPKSNLLSSKSPQA